MKTALFTGRLEVEPRFVGELAEIHLERVRGGSEHVDVRAGAKYIRLAAGDDHRLDLGVLETKSVDHISKLEIDPDVVAVLLQHVARPKGLVLHDGHHQLGDGAIEREFPVLVLARMRLEANCRRLNRCVCHRLLFRG